MNHDKNEEMRHELTKLNDKFKEMNDNSLTPFQLIKKIVLQKLLGKEYKKYVW